MWASWIDGNETGIRIRRFMVDEAFQKRGIGRVAMALAIDEIMQPGDLDVLNVSYWPRNSVAKKLYASFGFVEIDSDGDGEIVAEIKVNQPKC